MKIKLARQKKQKITESIEQIFVTKVLGFDDALITDESLISDFFMFSLDKASGPGRDAGTYIFKFKKYTGPNRSMFDSGAEFLKAHRDPNNWREELIESEPDMGKEEIIFKTQEVFGVDIRNVYESYLVDILRYIVENYKAKT